MKILTLALIAALSACGAPQSSEAVPKIAAVSLITAHVINASQRPILVTQFSTCNPFPFQPPGGYVTQGDQWSATSQDDACLDDTQQTSVIQAGFRLSIDGTVCAVSVSNATGAPVFTIVDQGMFTNCTLSGSTLTYDLTNNDL